MPSITRTVLVSSLLICLSASGARADLGKWGKGAAVAGGVVAAYGAYKLYKHGKRIEQLEEQQAADREQRQRDEEDRQRNEAPAPGPVFQERLVLGDGSGQRAIYEVAPGRCAFKVQAYDSGYRFGWQTAFETPCNSTFAAPVVSKPQFDVGTGICSRSATYSTTGGNGTWTQPETLPFSSCGFTGPTKTQLTPKNDGVCEAYDYQFSTMNPAWVRVTQPRSVERSRCGFKLVGISHRVIARKEGELYPKCIKISEYAARSERNETFRYRTEDDELDLHQCGITRIEELSWDDFAKSARNLVALSLWKAQDDMSAAKSIEAADESAEPTSTATPAAGEQQAE